VQIEKDINTMTKDIANLTEPQETDENVRRHWCPQSEKFATGETLAHLLENGWKIIGVVFRQEHWYAGGRRVPVYHFKLQSGSQIQHVAVIENPFVTRLVNNLTVQVVLINQRKQQSSAERW
jgi:hypothetical protein